MVGLPEMRRGSTHLGDAAFDGRSRGNHCLAIDDDGLRDAAAKWIADSIAESGKGGIEAHHQGRPCGNGRSILGGDHRRQQ